MRRIHGELLALLVLAAGCGSGGSGTEERSLTIEVVGDGTTDPAPGVHRYAKGTSVTVKATPTEGHVLTGWSGDAAGTSGEVTVKLDAEKAVVAHFALLQTLTANTAGAGSGTITGGGLSCGATCTARHASGAAVTLTATAFGGSTFAGWSGACTGSGACVVTMAAAQTVTASFDVGAGAPRPSAGCGKARTLQDGTRTVQVGGGTRSYILRAPDGYDGSRPYRLIVAYHWLNGSAQEVSRGGSWASETPFFSLWGLAGETAVFVAPQGLNAGWANTDGQDVAFTDAMLAEVENELCVDLDRVFATGFSYGAAMSYAIACSRADVFRGVALYAGAELSGCSGGTTPIAFFAAHGLRDGTLGIAGGRSLRDHFVEVNGCAAQDPPEPAAGSGTHVCTTYQGCTDGHPVTWCAFDGDHNPNEHDRNQSKSWVPGEAWKFLMQF